MQLVKALKLLALLPTDPRQAKTVADLVHLWKEWRDMHDDSKHHTMRRWLNELSKPLVVGGPRPVRRVPGTESDAARYHRDRVALSTLFMPVEVSLMLVTAGRIFDRALGPQAGYDVADLEAAAEQAVVRLGRETANLVQAIRILPDGIDREDAWVDPEVLASTIDALKRERQLSFEYRRANDDWSLRTVHPLGLIAKDGARYLIAKEGAHYRIAKDGARHSIPKSAGDKGLRQYALHRMRDACVEPKALTRPWGFDLDTHLRDHLHGGAAVRLVLRVHKDALWHFEERRLIADQRIDETHDADWYRVSATLRETIQLVPFVLSMGQWVEVLEPQSVRDEVADRATKIAAHYASRP